MHVKQTFSIPLFNLRAASLSKPLFSISLTELLHECQAAVKNHFLMTYRAWQIADGCKLSCFFSCSFWVLLTVFTVKCTIGSFTLWYFPILKNAADYMQICNQLSTDSQFYGGFYHFFNRSLEIRVQPAKSSSLHKITLSYPMCVCLLASVFFL